MIPLTSIWNYGYGFNEDILKEIASCCVLALQSLYTKEIVYKVIIIRIDK